MKDSLTISQNEDGSFTINWDPNDPEWNWLNGKTSEEITKIVENAIKFDNGSF